MARGQMAAWREGEMIAACGDQVLLADGIARFLGTRGGSSRRGHFINVFLGDLGHPKIGDPIFL